MSDQPTTQFLKDAFPYALGYWQGRACGNFENGTYENMSDFHKNLFKLGYDAGVADYAEMDTVNYLEEDEDDTDTWLAKHRDRVDAFYAKGLDFKPDPGCSMCDVHNDYICFQHEIEQLRESEEEEV